MAAISFADTSIISSLDAADVGSKIRAVQIFIWKRMSENYFQLSSNSKRIKCSAEEFVTFILIFGDATGNVA